MFVFGFFIPLLIISVFYTAMFIKLRKNSHFLSYNVRYSHKSETTIDENTFTNRTEDFHIKNKITKKFHKRQCLTVGFRIRDKINCLLIQREIRLVKMIFIMVLAFCFAWLPYSFISLYAQFGYNITIFVTPKSATMSVFLAKSSSFYNPIIYTLTNKNCVNFFHRLFNRRRKKT